MTLLTSSDFTDSIFDYTEEEIDRSLTALEEETFARPLLECFRKLNTAGKGKVIEYAMDLAESRKYTSPEG